MRSVGSLCPVLEDVVTADTNPLDLTSRRGMLSRGMVAVLHAPTPARRLTFSARLSCESMVSTSCKIMVEISVVFPEFSFSTAHGNGAAGPLYKSSGVKPPVLDSLFPLSPLSTVSLKRMAQTPPLRLSAPVFGHFPLDCYTGFPTHPASDNKVVYAYLRQHHAHLGSTN